MDQPQQPNKHSTPETETWTAADQDLLKASLMATPAQRLAWLEEAIELAYRSGALPTRNSS